MGNNLLKGWFGSDYGSIFQQGLVASAFMFLIKVARCTIKTYTQNEFEEEVKFQDGEAYERMLAICKFCQIIANKETLCYEDDLVAVFKDIRPAAQ